ncbi:bifunctional diaminohydroxyphosphoribosylaminopyrimidine deaminase/5-amino-6-(5-phosphoribosylamino)uracil reductase RibD [Paracoccaceae bacterium GXU_MW_L88]
MSQRADIAHMRHAIALARRGLGACWPNPSVGCVIVKDGRVIGRGRTAAGGRPHAEPQALAMAGDAAGATAYVTLEPCAHHGRTPPCADALIAAGVASVVVALRDPDPRVDGGGIAKLKAAGIEVTEGICAEEAREVTAGFLMRIQHGRPLVTLKLATSVDGRIATASGESRWITGSEARRAVHALRSRHDGVLVGSGTALADDPMLDVRGFGDVPQPVRIVADRRLRLSPDGRLGQSAKKHPALLIHSADAPKAAREAWAENGAELREISTDADGLDLPHLLKTLGDYGLNSVLCEGGGSFAAALLKAGLVDRLIHVGAGLALGADGRPALGALPPAPLAAFPRFALHETRAVGGDVWTEWRPTSTL